MIKLPNIVYENKEMLLSCLLSNKCNEKCNKDLCSLMHDQGFSVGLESVVYYQKCYTYKEVIDAIKLHIKIEKIRKINNENNR